MIELNSLLESNTGDNKLAVFNFISADLTMIDPLQQLWKDRYKVQKYLEKVYGDADLFSMFDYSNGFVLDYEYSGKVTIYNLVVAKRSWHTPNNTSIDKAIGLAYDYMKETDFSILISPKTTWGGVTADVSIHRYFSNTNLTVVYL